MDLVGSGNASIKRRISCFASTIGVSGPSCEATGPLRRIRGQQTPGFALIENSPHTAVHVANRLGARRGEKELKKS
jgi:hypothetical protein